MLVRDRRGSGVGFAFGVGDRVECRRGRRAEGFASRTIDNREYDVTSGCNLDLILLRIELQINEIEASYITIHRYTLYFEALCGLKDSKGPMTPLIVWIDHRDEFSSARSSG